MSLRSILEVADEQAAEDLHAVDGENDREVEATDEEVTLPSLGDAASEERERDDEASVDDETSTSVTSPPATSTAATPPTTDTEQKSPEPTASVPGTSEPPPSESAAPAEPSEVAEVAENVAVGRWFTVTGPDGVELGAAKVDDIVRTPGCGVELTLSIVTSDETGPDRWASIRPRYFAEVRPGGTTRDARPIGSNCEHAANSRTTSLSPDREYEIGIAFLLDDSAQRAVLRPEGAAGWVFDLPPLTQVATTTSHTTTPSATAGPSATTSAPTATSTTEIAEA